MEEPWPSTLKQASVNLCRDHIPAYSLRRPSPGLQQQSPDSVLMPTAQTRQPRHGDVCHLAQGQRKTVRSLPPQEDPWE